MSLVQSAGAVFGVLLTQHAVIAVAHSRAHVLHPHDLLLLANLIRSNDSFRQAQTFSPICLPHFNASAFLHSYVHYLDNVSTEIPDPDHTVSSLLQILSFPALWVALPEHCEHCCLSFPALCVALPGHKIPDPDHCASFLSKASALLHFGLHSLDTVSTVAS